MAVRKQRRAFEGSLRLAAKRFQVISGGGAAVRDIAAGGADLGDVVEAGDFESFAESLMFRQASGRLTFDAIQIILTAGGNGIIKACQCGPKVY